MEHIPILRKTVTETFDYLSMRSDVVFVDGTLGAGGHAVAIATKLKEKNTKFKVVGIDKDQGALSIAQKYIEIEGLTDYFTPVHDDFKNIKSILDKLGIAKIDGALLDLGVSSMQLDNKKRGFSFQDPSQPLDMRMDSSQELDAAHILNEWPIDRIEKIIFEFGEEKLATKIAWAISERRKQKQPPFKQIGDLIDLLAKAIPVKSRFGGKIHFATRTFQALRIAVNSELIYLGGAINEIVDSLRPASKIAIISFHSLEDRIVKNAFNSLANPCTCPPDLPCVCGKKPAVKILIKKPIVPTTEEVKLNPRSRSAKLRVIEKL
ncbi:MAG TPA: 16S rRNA (cytosine(1402)-N(4))-methyltransferase RsmH [bacterium]|nr:16S rRNA (cytosine(1402)-N(4))-methyltransferase RsmH [bacterium]